MSGWVEVGQEKQEVLCSVCLCESTLCLNVHVNILKEHVLFCFFCCLSLFAITFSVTRFVSYGHINFVCCCAFCRERRGRRR